MKLTSQINMFGGIALQNCKQQVATIPYNRRKIILCTLSMTEGKRASAREEGGERERERETNKTCLPNIIQHPSLIASAAASFMWEQTRRETLYGFNMALKQRRVRENIPYSGIKIAPSQLAFLWPWASLIRAKWIAVQLLSVFQSRIPPSVSNSKREARIIFVSSYRDSEAMPG